MTTKLAIIALLSASSFAQRPTAAPDTRALWRQIRNALVSDEGQYFPQIKDSEIPPEHWRFDGSVVSQPAPNELLVNVDAHAGDALLRFLFSLKGPIAAGTQVHFEGVLRAFKRDPYRLTFELEPGEITGLPSGALP